jgi:phosphoserine phosphatase
VGDEMKDYTGLVCLDMDRVLVDHLSTWQFVYDQLGVNNDESFELYNQGLLNEWDWIKLDIALLKGSRSELENPLTDSEMRGHLLGVPMMKNYKKLIATLIEKGFAVAIVSGGLQQTARDIAAQFPSEQKWKKRWGGIDRHTSNRLSSGFDTKLHVFTNGWLVGKMLPSGEYLLDDFGRYQVQMNGKGAVVKMLQRRLGISKERTASVGDSAGDIGMFSQSSLAICFNPWDDKPKQHADVVVEEKDLAIVLELITNAIN